MDMTATTPNIEARIATERKRLFDEQALQVELEKQRLIPLEAGNDEVLDEIEGKIVKSIERAERTQERIALLERRLNESKQTDENARLDEIAAGAERARQRGVAIITKTYPKLAKQLGEALAELAECESTIWSANHQLTTAKRIDSVVGSPNASRFARTPLQEDVNLPTEFDDGNFYWQKDAGALDAIRNQFGGVPRSTAQYEQDVMPTNAVPSTNRGE